MDRMTPTRSRTLEADMKLARSIGCLRTRKFAWNPHASTIIRSRVIRVLVYIITAHREIINDGIMISCVCKCCYLQVGHAHAVAPAKRVTSAAGRASAPRVHRGRIRGGGVVRSGPSGRAKSDQPLTRRWRDLPAKENKVKVFLESRSETRRVCLERRAFVRSRLRSKYHASALARCQESGASVTTR